MLTAWQSAQTNACLNQRGCRNNLSTEILIKSCRFIYMSRLVLSGTTSRFPISNIAVYEWMNLEYIDNE